MAINRIKTGGITDATIQSGDIAPGTISSDRLAGSVANAKLANSAITINGTSIALGASGEIVAGTDWQAVTVADGSTTLTAEAGKGYFLDTNAGVIEVFLPTSPSRGDTIVLADYAGHFALNKVIVNTGGQNIDSSAGNFFEITTNNSVVSLVYVDSAKGWLVYKNTAVTALSSALTVGNLDIDPAYVAATGGTVTTSGDFKIHSFTGDGCFVVSNAGNGAGSDSVSYMVVAGGGGGGFGGPGAGGGSGAGAGGFREGKSSFDSYTASPLVAPDGITVSAQTYPVTVGAGGAAGSAPSTGGASGSNSVFATITSAGGGGGGGDLTVSLPAQPGGSGAAAPAPACNSAACAGALGNNPPVSPPQGQPGGGSAGGKRGGGGGATQAGTSSNQTNVSPAPSSTPVTGAVGGGNYGWGGKGGDGATTSISASPTTYAGGGGGGGYESTSMPDARAGVGGLGGSGGGGNARYAPPGFPSNGTAGSANTGGGGGGGMTSPRPGYAGGKGIVIIRYRYQA